MKKFLGLLLVAGTAATLSACSNFSLPACNEDLDDCNRSGAYTEERTVPAGTRVATTPVVVAPAPAPVMVKAPTPAPAPVIVQAPAPAPARVIIDDTPVMRSAEPHFTHITK